MSTTDVAPAVPDWAAAIPGLGLEWGGSVLVLGEDARRVAEAYRAAGAPEVAFGDRRVAFLSAEEPPTGLEEARPEDLPLPGDALDLVVLRHAVDNQRDLQPALREAYRVLRPGGGLLVADVNLETLVDSSAFRYPSRILYDLFPEVLRLEMARHIDSADLGVEVVRAGFRAVDGHDLDYVSGEYPDHQAYLEAVRRHGWRGFDHLEQGEIEQVLARLTELLPHIAPGGAVVEREPWHLVRGQKPGQPS